VRTDEPCRVEVLGHEQRTFTVAGHHFALVATIRIEKVDERGLHETYTAALASSSV